jgi:hypothetical protein
MYYSFQQVKCLKRISAVIKDYKCYSFQQVIMTLYLGKDPHYNNYRDMMTIELSIVWYYDAISC